jgi:hypothetical protein
MGSTPSSPVETPVAQPVEKHKTTVQSLDIPKRNTVVEEQGHSVDTVQDDLDQDNKEEILVPVQVFWNSGGKSVFVTGTFNKWKQRIKLDQIGSEFSNIIQMPLGTQHLKFIVDDEWKCCQDLPIASDEEGNLINYLQISLESQDVGDGLDDLSESTSLIDIKDQTPSSPPGSYTREIPEIDLQKFVLDEPCTLPIYLEKVLLNHKVVPKDPTTLQTPSHVSLNHLYTCSIRDNVLSIACTSR